MNELNKITEKQKPYEVKVMDKRFKENDITLASQTDLIMAAVQKGYTPEFIEKMMALQERFEANEARKAYNVAMAKFKASPPKIWRDMQVKYGTGDKATNWSHADLATAAEAINKSLGENGLNSTWRTLPLDNNKTRITCIIAHELGHSEETYLEADPDTSGSKNPIQAIGSTVFYLERYTLFALTGLAPARMDNDGKGTGKESAMANDQQILDIQTLQKDAKLSNVDFKKRLKKKFDVEKPEDLTETQAISLIRSLEAIKDD